MTKILKLDGLDCANCAAKIERKASKIKGVDDVNVDFFTCKMHLELKEYTNEIAVEIEKAIKKASCDINILEI